MLRRVRARFSDARARRRLSPTARGVLRERLTYLSAEKLANLEWCADAHERYAVFAAGDATDIGGDPYYGYVDDLYERVVASFRAHGVAPGDRVRLHRGLFEDTLRPRGPLALVHIDSDWYEPVRLCLERTDSHLSHGAFVVLDDYHDYDGCRAATDDFLRDHAELVPVRDRGNLVLQRR